MFELILLFFLDFFWIFCFISYFIYFFVYAFKLQINFKYASWPLGKSFIQFSDSSSLLATSILLSFFVKFFSIAYFEEVEEQLIRQLALFNLQLIWQLFRGDIGSHIQQLHGLNFKLYWQSIFRDWVFFFRKLIILMVSFLLRYAC